jgi:hypothetical protein
LHCPSLSEFINEYDAVDRADIFGSVANALAKAGFKDAALYVAIDIENKFSRASTLSSVSIALTKVNSTAARDIALEALRIMQEIKDEFYRASTMASVAEALHKADLAAEAQVAIAESLSDARETEDAWDLMYVIDFWLMVGVPEPARSLIEEVQIAIGKIYSDDERSFALGHLAEISARLHDYRTARETAEMCSSSADRLRAYTTILREYHIERDPSLARLFAEEEEEDEDD